MQISLPKSLRGKSSVKMPPSQKAQRKRNKALFSNGNGNPNPRFSAQSAPVARMIPQSGGAPRIVRTANGTRIKHSELIGSVAGSVAFSATKFAVNPGVAATFPWLSATASQFERYKMHSCSFRYVTRTSTATVGSVIGAADYDPTDQSPTTELILTAFLGSREHGAWQNMTYPLDPSRMHGMVPRKLCRAIRPGGADLNNFDVANFYLATIEEVGTDNIGKLWVDYDCEFFTPQLAPAQSVSSAKANSYWKQVGAQTFATGVAEAVDFDAATVDPLGFGNDSTGVFTPAAGVYRVNFSTTVSDTAAEAFTAAVELQKNSITFGLSQLSTAAGGRFPMTADGLVSFNGTDTFSVVITMTGAAGTLTTLANNDSLIIMMA